MWWGKQTNKKNNKVSFHLSRSGTVPQTYTLYWSHYYVVWIRTMLSYNTTQHILTMLVRTGEKADPSQWPQRSGTRRKSAIPSVRFPGGSQATAKEIKEQERRSMCDFELGHDQIHGTLSPFLKPQRHRELGTSKHSVFRVGELGSPCIGNVYVCKFCIASWEPEITSVKELAVCPTYRLQWLTARIYQKQKSWRIETRTIHVTTWTCTMIH